MVNLDIKKRPSCFYTILTPHSKHLHNITTFRYRYIIKIYYENKAVPQTFCEEIDNKYSDTIWCNFFYHGSARAIARYRLLVIDVNVSGFYNTDLCLV